MRKRKTPTSSRRPPRTSPGTSQGVETLRGQDSETLGAGEEPLVADSMTRSVSFASQLSVAEPSPVAVATHRSDVLGSALEASRTVQPFSSVLGALVGDASPEAVGADDAVDGADRNDQREHIDGDLLTEGLAQPVQGERRSRGALGSGRK